MSSQNFPSAVAGQAAKTLRGPVRWVARRNRLLWASVGLLVVMVVWTTLISPHLNRRVVLYASTPGSDVLKEAQELADSFNQAGHWPFRYELEVRPSEGFRHNRELVSRAARTGERVIGYDLDGFGTRGRVATLLPLDHMCLYAVARAEAPGDKRADGPQTVSGVLDPIRNRLLADTRLRDALRQASVADPLRAAILWLATIGGKPAHPPRVYLGQVGSGSRQAAEAVLESIGYTPAACDAGSGLTKAVAFERLARGDLDLVFDLKRRESRTITDLAQSKRFQAVGLDDVAGLCGNESGLTKYTLDKGSHAPGFCPNDRPTVRGRLLFICPETMSEWDAHILAAGLHQAREKTGDSTDGELKIPPHPGTRPAGAGGLSWLWRVIRDYWYITLSTVGFVAWTFAQAWKGANQLPVLGKIEDVNLRPGDRSHVILIEVSDEETPQHLIQFQAVTDNHKLFPPRSLVFWRSWSGDGNTHWELELRPAEGEYGEATVVVTADDGERGVAKQDFKVRVGPPLLALPAAAGETVRWADEVGRWRSQVVALEDDADLLTPPRTPAERADLLQRCDELRKQLRGAAESTTLADDLRGQVEKLRTRAAALYKRLRAERRGGRQRTTSDTPTAPASTT